MHWRSTTARFAALVFLLQIAAAGALLLCVHVIVRGQVYTDAAVAGEGLREDLLAIEATAGIDPLRHAVAMRAADASDAVLLLVAPDGRAIAGNLSAWPPDPALDQGPAHVELFRRQRDVAERMLLRATRLPGGYRLLTGVTVDDEARTVRLLELAMPVAFCLATAFAALAAWLAARMIVIRLDRAVETLGAVRDGDLDRRAPVGADGDAFATLAAAINAALDRIRRLMEELTLATDMLAHDLKSPLTRLRSALEHAAANADTPAAQEAADRALGEGERLLHIVETALRVSRAEAGIGRDAFTAVDPAALVGEIAEIYGPLVEDAGRAIYATADTRGTVPLHRELLAQALGNLIDNALKYGAGTITLAADTDPQGIVIRVSDEGPGIPPEHQATALRRFGRIDEARGGSGAGLGLSLVAAVARLHGGDIAIGNQGGLVVAMTLPVGSQQVVSPDTRGA